MRELGGGAGTARTLLVADLVHELGSARPRTDLVLDPAGAAIASARSSSSTRPAPTELEHQVGAAIAGAGERRRGGRGR